ncbi:MAG: hypothetical protein RR396_05515 [Clostridiales bacterium]
MEKNQQSSKIASKEVEERIVDREEKLDDRDLGQEKKVKKSLRKGKIAKDKEVLEFLTRLLRGEVGEEIYGKDGKAAYQEPGLRERLKAAELLGKGCGAFNQKEEAKDALKDDFQVEIKILP